MICKFLREDAVGDVRGGDCAPVKGFVHYVETFAVVVEDLVYPAVEVVEDSSGAASWTEMVQPRRNRDDRGGFPEALLVVLRLSEPDNARSWMIADS